MRGGRGHGVGGTRGHTGQGSDSGFSPEEAGEGSHCSALGREGACSDEFNCFPHEWRVKHHDTESTAGLELPGRIPNSIQGVREGFSEEVTCDQVGGARPGQRIWKGKLHWGEQHVVPARRTSCAVGHLGYGTVSTGQDTGGLGCWAKCLGIYPEDSGRPGGAMLSFSGSLPLSAQSASVFPLGLESRQDTLG